MPDPSPNFLQALRDYLHATCAIVGGWAMVLGGAYALSAPFSKLHRVGGGQAEQEA